MFAVEQQHGSILALNLPPHLHREAAASLRLFCRNLLYWHTSAATQHHPSAESASTPLSRSSSISSAVLREPPSLAHISRYFPFCGNLLGKRSNALRMETSPGDLSMYVDIVVVKT